ncbi:MAG: 5'-methylthioadenosine/adenosylhomocysteine nucleosidase [Erysipelotrichaceae bacterium]
MIAIIGAMQVEVDELCNLMQNVEKKQIFGTDFYTGSLANHEVVLMKSGVGKGNAAMNTTILLQQFPITHIINIGTAGGLLATQNVLDVVISERVIQHDYDTSALDGEAGIGLTFEASSNLVQQAKALMEQEACQVFVGDIVSGDQFISEPQQLETIKAKFVNAMCAEMEAGAIAQVAQHFNVAYVVIRSLSDVASNPESHMDFVTYVQKASKRSAEFCERFVALV